MTQQTGTVAWRELLDEATQRLTKAAVGDAPGVDAWRIVEEASGFAGAELEDADPAQARKSQVSWSKMATIPPWPIYNGICSLAPPRRERRSTKGPIQVYTSLEAIDAAGAG